MVNLTAASETKAQQQQQQQSTKDIVDKEATAAVAPKKIPADRKSVV